MDVPMSRRIMQSDWKKKFILWKKCPWNVLTWAWNPFYLGTGLKICINVWLLKWILTTNAPASRGRARGRWGGSRSGRWHGRRDLKEQADDEFNTLDSLLQHERKGLLMSEWKINEKWMKMNTDSTEEHSSDKYGTVGFANGAPVNMATPANNA